MIYLNNAAASWPKAPGVIKAVSDDIAQMPAPPGRVTCCHADPLTECRKHLARFLGAADPSRIILTSSTTHALNLAILGLDLQPGDEVVTSVIEHNSVLRPLFRLEDETGIHVSVIGITPDGGIDVQAYEQALARQPKLVVLNHASNVTGRIQPIDYLFEKAHKAGAKTLADAAQSLGHLKLDVSLLHADLVAFAGHKGLRGPAGTGGLYVAPGLDLKQVFVGGTGVRSDLRNHPADMPTRLECGTPALSSFAGLAAAMRWHETNGAGFIELERARTRQLKEGLRSIPGVHLFGDAADDLCTNVVSFGLDNWEAEELGYILSESFEIVSRVGLHCAPLIHKALGVPKGTVRLSPSGETTELEIEQCLKAVRTLAA